jgi:hypothetical protein
MGVVAFVMHMDCVAAIVYLNAEILLILHPESTAANRVRLQGNSDHSDGRCAIVIDAVANRHLVAKEPLDPSSACDWQRFGTCHLVQRTFGRELAEDPVACHAG